MTPFDEPVRIHPSLQRYAWGDLNIIQGLLDLPFTGEPIAEAWFGAHPVAPATISDNGKEISLDSFIQRHQQAVLGPEIQQAFGELPYLMKLLAAKKPLSIQVHPTPEQAAQGFAAEEQAGIPRDAKHRSYRDPNPKPEILVALTPFHALAGFRPVDAITHSIEQHPELGQILSNTIQSPKDLHNSIHQFLTLPHNEVESHLSSLINRLQETLAHQAFNPSCREHWFLRTHQHTSRDGRPDRGLVFVFMMELLTLQPGQAFFIPPGVLHAYLEGGGVELMANSDNVLRAGLSPKHINISELLKVIQTEAATPSILEPIPTDHHHTARYPLDIPEFQLEKITLPAQQHISKTSFGPQTILITHATKSLRILTEQRCLTLGRGQAAMIFHGQRYSLESDTPAELLVASIPKDIHVSA